MQTKIKNREGVFYESMLLLIFIKLGSHRISKLEDCEIGMLKNTEPLSKIYTDANHLNSRSYPRVRVC